MAQCSVKNLPFTFTFHSFLLSTFPITLTGILTMQYCTKFHFGLNIPQLQHFISSEDYSAPEGKGLNSVQIITENCMSRACVI